MMMMTLRRLAALALIWASFACAPAHAQFTDRATGLFTTTGSANAYLVTIPNVNSLADVTAIKFTIVPNFTNTGAATLNISSSGVKNVLKPGPAGLTALTGNELISGQPAIIQYDGTEYWIASSINSTAPTTYVAPQGYLTPCPVAGGVSGCTAGTLVPTGDVSAVSVLYYEPVIGNQIPIWNGVQMVNTQFTEAQLTLTLGSSNLANTLYDALVFSNSGTPTICTSVAWSTSTAGSGARGTGAGTAQISRAGNTGIYTNTVSASCKNGASTYTVGAGLGTVVATVFMDGTNGQVSFLKAYGQSRKWAVSNLYNKQPIALSIGDGTASWTYGTASLRACNNASANSGTALSALGNDTFNVESVQAMNSNVPSGATVRSGIGLNNTSAATGKQGYQLIGGAIAVGADLVSQALIAPTAPGVNVMTCLEQGGGSGTQTWLGTITNTLMTIKWGG